MNHTHLALTIGPIYRTLSKAKKVRELWASSFFYSYLMRELLSELKARPEIATILAPSVLDINDVNTKHFGAGIWPDRAFFLLNSDIESSALDTVCKNVLTRISANVALNQQNLINELQLYFIKANIPGNENAIFYLNKLLDSQELLPKFSAVEAGNTFFKDLVDWPTINKLKVEAYEVKDPIRAERRYPSIIEIATRDLSTLDKSKFEEVIAQNSDDLEENIIDGLKMAFGDELKLRHRYIAIVQADGDNIGELIGKIGNDKTQIDTFSKLLMTFSTKAAGVISEYGGLPIYVGGDDLLFLAPVFGKGSKKTILQLLGELDKLLINEFDPFLKGIGQPNKISLSFGLSVTYYKHPMGEALQTAYELLFENAKKQTGKNSVAFKVQKHSGNFFEANLGLKTKSISLLDTLMTTDYETEFMSGIMHKLENLKHFLRDAACDELHHDKRMTAFFDQNFNEAKERDFLDNKVKPLIVEVFQTHKPVASDVKAIDNAIKTIFAHLRWVQFVQAKNLQDA